MLNQQELEKAIDALLDRFEEVNRFFVAKIAAQIKKIGELNQSSINRLTLMSEMNFDMFEINKKLADAVSMSTADLLRMVYRREI